MYIKGNIEIKTLSTFYSSFIVESDNSNSKLPINITKIDLSAVSPKRKKKENIK